MGLLDNILRSHAEFTADTDQFGEQVTYTRLDTTATTPTVIVDRNAPTRDPDFPVNTRVFDVWIPYDAGDSFGLSAEPAQGDQITLKNDPSDGSNVTKEFAGIVSADTGGWLVQFI